MATVHVKICGITSERDALTAAFSGASALGFVFSESPRKVSPENARSIIEKLPPFVQSVGVFVDEPEEWIKKVTGYCGLDIIQLHGKEPPSTCKTLGPRVIKAFRVKDPAGLVEIGRYRDVIRGALLDSWVKGVSGGTGRSFNWGLVREAQNYGIPIILAGGLNPQNIGKAVWMTRPFGVDVSSGVERRPGVKDPDLVHMFLEQARHVKSEDKRNA